MLFTTNDNQIFRQYLSKIFKSIKPKYTSNAKILIRNFHAFGLIILVLTILVHGYSTQGSQHLRSLEKNWEVKLNKVIDGDSTVNYESKYRDLFKEIEAKTYFLAQWNRIWVTSMIPISEDLQKLTDRSKETYELYEKLNMFRDSTRNKPIQTIQEIENNYFFIKNLTKYALVPMTSFLLPFLYAMLGSLAFVVRDLSYKLKKDMLLSRSFTNVGVRLFTGSLAGLTIGMFISDSGSSPITVQNLSSDALAFLAGYNIELLFHTMDTIIQAITGKRLVDGVDDESLNKLAQRVKELNDG